MIIIKRKFIIVLFVVIISLTICGCWNHNELNSLGIILGAGIEKIDPDTYEVTIQTIKDVNENTKDEYIITSAKGRTVFEADRNISLNLSRKNYWPHTKIAILGHQLAEDGILPAVDFFIREPQRRVNVNFILCNDTSEALFSSTGDYDSVSSLSVLKIIDESKYNGYGINTNIVKLVEESESLTGAALIDEIKILSKNNQGSSANMHNKSIALNRVGVFYKYKLVGYIPAKDTLFVNLIRNNIKNAVFPIDINNEGKDTMTIEISKSSTKINPIIENGNYIADVDIKIKGKIAEYSGKKDIQKITQEDINESFKNKMEGEINRVFDGAKSEIGVDIFNIGNKFANKFPYLLKLSQDEWKKIFIKNVVIRPHVTIDIDYTGKINQ